MKNLKILTFGILLIGMSLTSCKKDADQQFQNAGNQQLQPDAQAQNKEKLFERSITIYNADKTTSTTLRFRAASKEQLDKMALENIEFTLVKTPESAKEATGVAASTLPGDEGYAAYSGKDASQLQSTNEKQVLPADGIQIDLPSLPKTESISIEVKSKDLNKEQAAAASCALVANTFHYIKGYHKIKVTNQGDCQIVVSFYHKNLLGAWVSVASGIVLNQNGWTQYSNCTWTVAATVSHATAISYVVSYFKSC
jgi:hypothetical protein